jgi:NTE family protein
MTTRAVVLGGGGPVGVAWEAGLAAGLEEQGIRLTDADLFVGTSAGSVVGSQLALGRSPGELVATQIAIADGDRPEQRAVQRSFDMGPLIQTFLKVYTSDAPLQELRAEVGAFALKAEAMSEEEWLPTFGRESNFTAWPERSFMCTAIDTADGALVTWTKDSGVPMVLAVASSCAVPGIVAPVTINGRRYMDGGIGSTTNAQLAKGHDKVLVVPVVASRARPGYEDIGARIAKRFEDELQSLRDSGSAVEVITPDEESRAAFGPNFMDGTRRKPCVEAGLRQGRLEAERLREWW